MRVIEDKIIVNRLCLFVCKIIFRDKGLVLVLPNQLVATELIEVLIVFPELEVLALALIPSYLVKDTQIGCVVFGAEFLHYLSQESQLLFVQEFRTLRGAEVGDKAILLD